VAAQVPQHVVLRPREPRALGDLDLPADEVEAGAPFGDRMLDLEAGVHLQEVEGAGIAVDEELAGAGADVVDGERRLDRHVSHLPAQFRGDDRRRRLLDHLLVAPLHAALALAEPEAGAFPVGEHLDLHVARPRYCLFNVDARVAEGGHRLALRGGEGPVELLGALDEAHSLPAAARRRLEHDRVADLQRVVLRGRLLPFGNRLLHSRHDRDAGVARLAAGAGLLAHLLHRGGRRTDEDDARVRAGAGKGGVLGEEAVPGMDGVRPRLLRGGDHVVDDEIALPGRGRAHPDGLVAAAHVQSGPVGVAIDGDGRDAHLLAGAGDADRDLAAVGDQDLAELHEDASDDRVTLARGGVRSHPCARVRGGRSPDPSRRTRVALYKYTLPLRPANPLSSEDRCVVP